MNYENYVDIVENQYFGNVCRADFDAVLKCFTDTARVLIYHGDNQTRHFSADGSDGDPLISFYEHLNGNFNPRFENFTHYVDVASNRCASHFLVTLQPKADSDYFAKGVQQLNNCNFFDFRGDLIDYMIIYYANPRATSAQTPTGYPRA